MFKLFTTIFIFAVAIILGVCVLFDGIDKIDDMQESNNIIKFNTQSQIIKESYEIALVENYNMTDNLKINSQDYVKTLAVGGYIGEIPEYNGERWSSGQIEETVLLQVAVNTPLSCLLIEQERDVRIKSLQEMPQTAKEINPFGCWKEYSEDLDEYSYIAYQKLKDI